MIIRVFFDTTCQKVEVKWSLNSTQLLIPGDKSRNVILKKCLQSFQTRISLHYCDPRFEIASKILNELEFFPRFQISWTPCDILIDVLGCENMFYMRLQ
jgi:hypothetical protein